MLDANGGLNKLVNERRFSLSVRPCITEGLGGFR